MKKTGQRKAKLIGIEELGRTNENTQVTSHTGRNSGSGFWLSTSHC